jgi:hypothetical protein
LGIQPLAKPSMEVSSLSKIPSKILVIFRVIAPQLQLIFCAPPPRMKQKVFPRHEIHPSASLLITGGSYLCVDSKFNPEALLESIPCCQWVFSKAKVGVFGAGTKVKGERSIRFNLTNPSQLFTLMGKRGATGQHALPAAADQLFASSRVTKEISFSSPMCFQVCRMNSLSSPRKSALVVASFPIAKYLSS